jgi:hypothetical protein
VQHQDWSSDHGGYLEENCECLAARVTVETDEPAYPLARDSDIIYPIGKFTTVLCGPELADAVAKKRVRKWHELAEYDMSQVTGDFARRMYIERERADHENDQEVSTWAKQVLNSLPGKMGYRHRCWETVPGAVAPEAWGEWHQLDGDGILVRWRSLAGVCQREVTGGYGPDAVPAMAAWICAHGRYRLLQAIRVAGWENVAYVDTDTLIVNETGLESLVNTERLCGNHLGQLELRAGWTDCEIIGIKHYIENGSLKCSGSPHGVYTDSKDGKSRWYTPAISESARSRVPMGTVARRVDVPRAGTYNHGVVQPDGTVQPHLIRE